MNAKEYLNRVRFADRLINVKDKELHRLRLSSTVKAKKGSWITLSEWEYDEKLNANVPVCVKTVQVDGEMIKEDTFYKLENGEFVEV